jgi:hypothetical protein
MTLKTFIIAAAATVALASTASANAFSFNEMDISGSTAELGQISVDGNASVSLYDFHGGAQGALLGATDLASGANFDVRVKLGQRPINDVVAVLTVNGQIVDTQEIDLDR